MISDHPDNQGKKIFQLNIIAFCDIYEIPDFFPVLVLHQVEAGICKIIGTPQSPINGTISPENHFVPIGSNSIQSLLQRTIVTEVNFRVKIPAKSITLQICANSIKILFRKEHGKMKTAKNHRKQMSCLHIEIVSDSILICRHGGNEIRSILLIVVFAELDRCDLGNGISFIGRFQCGREQGLLLHRLRRKLRIDAAGAQIQQFFHPGPICRVNHIAGDHQVAVDEICRISHVRHDPSDFSCGEKYIFRTFLFKKSKCFRLIGQIKFPGGAGDEICESLLLQSAENCGTDQPGMSGNINSGILLHCHHSCGITM